MSQIQRLSEEITAIASLVEKRNAWLAMLEADVVELTAQRDELLASLKAAVEVIHVWHGIQGGTDAAWIVYLRHSPEMRRFTDAIAKAEGR